MEPIQPINPPPPSFSGFSPAPGLPPARFAGWSALSSDASGSTGPPPSVPYPVIRYNECFPGLTNLCNPGPGKCVVPAVQPVIPVPIYQEIKKKDKIIEVPQTVVVDKLTPNLWMQEVNHQIPDVHMIWKEKKVSIPRVELVEKPIEIPVPVGYNFQIVPKWEVREVPKVIPKYVGKQEIIEVEVPQIKVIDTTVETEMPVYVGEKTVEKRIIEEEPVEVVEYKYVEQEKEVPIYKYKPVFNVEVDIPRPLVVPVPVRVDDANVSIEHVSFDDYAKIRQNSLACSGLSSCCQGLP